ncbi:UDP-glucose 6-dehydrogenase (plasmid) [Deltaproteobacteria bacterium Smac51]|nr:UDP-glucose 6-dehydrogenase [Deltaproteobacteria bacterium Smac51]
MKISVIGAGYVGLVCAAGFAEMGNQVVCVDSDEAKVARLRQGEIPIYEPGLEEMVLRNVDQNGLSFTVSLKEALEVTDICFIAVGTPMDEDGQADMSHVLAAAEDIGRYMVRSMYIVDKSTVPVGTAARVKAAIYRQLAARGVDYSAEVISNPEFLKEGAAILDFMKPDRIVVGADSENCRSIMRELYAPFVRNRDVLMFMDTMSAEMTKYAANAMLATKISFINEIANICEQLGADVNKVREGIGSDTRIGYSFIYPGCGYGGSCFPKDVEALIFMAENNGYEPSLLRSVKDVNNRQKEILVKKAVKRFGAEMRGLTFAVWGLAFKPGTDDMREAPSLTIINSLINCGAKIRAYDPQAIKMADFYFKGHEAIEYFDSKYEALRDADGLFLITEWKEFSSPDFLEMKKSLRQPVIFDGRNQYEKHKMREHGFEYFSIGA